MRCLKRRRGFDDGDAGGWGKGEVSFGGGDVFVDGSKGEGGGGAVDLFDAHVLDLSGGVDCEGQGVESLLHPFRCAGEGVEGGLVADQGEGEVVEFFGEFGVAEQEAERGAEVVELLFG